MMSNNIVEEFKEVAKNLGCLYRTRKELDALIAKHEVRCKELGDILEAADKFESRLGDEVK